MWILFLSILALSVIGSTISLDRLVKFEYDNCRKHWEENGQPTGFLWKLWYPNKSKNLVGFPKMSTQRALTKRQVIWLVSNPIWYDGQPKAKTLLLIYRLSVASPIIILISVIVLRLISII